MLLAELGIRVFFYIAKALIFQKRIKLFMNVKLRYTGARLTKQAGVSLQPVSGALTHSDKQVTKAYVITADIANQTVGENGFYKSQKNDSEKFLIDS